MAVVVLQLVHGCMDQGSILNWGSLMSNFFVNEKDSLIVSFGGA